MTRKIEEEAIFYIEAIDEDDAIIRAEGKAKRIGKKWWERVDDSQDQYHVAELTEYSEGRW